MLSGSSLGALRELVAVAGIPCKLFRNTQTVRWETFTKHTHQHPGPMHSHVLMDVKIFTTNWEDWQNAKMLYILQIPSLRTLLIIFQNGCKIKRMSCSLEKNNTMPTTISFFSMTMQFNISCRCQVNTRLKQPYQQKNLKQVSKHTLQILVMKSNCFLLILTWQRIWATALKVV